MVPNRVITLLIFNIPGRIFKMEKRTLRWVLAHEPIEIFIRAANRFARVISEKTDGAINIEILSCDEYAKKYHNIDQVNTQYRYELMKHLEEGQLEMTQLYTTTLGSQYHKDLLALDMPFLFNDHDHVARVLDGEIGDNLRDGFANKTNAQPLCFTYSGGFRVLPSSKKIENLSELAGEKVRTGSEVSKETFKVLGCDVVGDLLIEEIGAAIGDGRIVAGESTYPRLYGSEQTIQPSKTAKAVINTEHSLFLTTVLINKDLWASFDAELKEAFLEAAQEAALEERREALLDIEKNKARLESDNVDVVYLSQDDMEDFRAKTESVYDTLDHMFADGLVNKIKEA